VAGRRPGRWKSGLPARCHLLLELLGCRGACMNDSLGVRIDAAPSGQRIETADGALLRLEKCPGNTVSVEQLAEGECVALFGLEVAGKKPIPIELGATVDEGGNAAKGQIAAKDFAIKDRTLDPEPRCGGERAQRGHRIIGALQRPQ